MALNLLFVGHATAQLAGGRLSTDAAVQGSGYPLGEDVVFHPHVGVMGGMISNVFYEEDRTTQSAVVRLLAGFNLESVPADGRGPGSDASPSAQKTADWGLGVALRYDEYLHSREIVRSQRGLAVVASGRFVLFPEGQVQLYASDDFIRDTRSHNFEQPGTLDRYINRFLVGVRFRPRGSALTGDLKYENTVDWFEDLSFANRIHHRFTGRADFRLFPRTQIYAQASQAIKGTFGDGGELRGLPYPEGVRSYPLELKLGIDTLLTELTSARAFFGWGWGFYEGDTASYSAPVYGTELGYRYSPLGRVLFQFQRRFQDSLNANFYGDYLFELKAIQQVGPAQLSGAGRYIHRTYRGLPPGISMEERRVDNILELIAEGRYYLKESFAFVATYSLASVHTDFRYQPDPDNMPLVFDDPSYIRHKIFAGAQASF